MCIRDSCKDVPIPTGRFTGTLHWPRVDGVPAWRPQDMAGRAGFERPIDELQAEEAQRAAVQRRDDAKRYLPANAIRARIEAMAPAGTAVERVEVDRGAVRIAYSAPDPDIDVLLNRISDAAGSAQAARPVDVVHRVTVSGGTHTRGVEFVLTDSPLVLRDASTAPATPVPVSYTHLDVYKRQVAHGPHAVDAGVAVLVDDDAAALVELHTGTVGQQALARGLATHGDQQLVEHDVLLARGVGIGHVCLLYTSRCV